MMTCWTFSTWRCFFHSALETIVGFACAGELKKLLYNSCFLAAAKVTDFLDSKPFISLNTSLHYLSCAYRIYLFTIYFQHMFDL